MVNGTVSPSESNTLAESLRISRLVIRFTVVAVGMSNSLSVLVCQL